MAKSSINFQKAKAHSFAHNFREDKPNYLLPKKHQEQNEYWKNSKTDKQIFDEELSKAKRKGGRIPKFENSIWEAVLNLNKIHTIEDAKKVAEHIENKFNIICSSISIHKDEGYLDENKKPIRNYHAHINFSTYKDGKQNWRKEHITPAKLSELQTEISVILKMDRGKINSKAKRLNHEDFKIKAKELAKQKDLKAEIRKLRAELKKHKAPREDYAELEQFNRDLKEQIKNKDLTLKELEDAQEAYSLKLGVKNESIEIYKKIEKLETKAISPNEIKEIIKEKIKENLHTVETGGIFNKKQQEVITNPQNFYNSTVEALLVLEKQKGEELVEKELESSYSQDMSRLQAENKELRTQNSYMKQKFDEIRGILNISRSTIDKIIDKIKRTMSSNKSLEAKNKQLREELVEKELESSYSQDLERTEAKKTAL